MTFITMEERLKKIENNNKFIEGLINDIHSNKSYSEKKYLQQFKESIKKDNYNKKCNNNNSGGQEFYTNQYSSNNVQISGATYSNYYGHRTPSLF